MSDLLTETSASVGRSFRHAAGFWRGSIASTPLLPRFSHDAVVVRVPGVVIRQAWFKDFIECLRRLLSLPPGWDSYGAAPVRVEAVDRAIALLAALLPPSPPELVPTREGGVQLEWHQPDADVEIEVRPDGGVHASAELHGESDDWRLTSPGDVERVTQALVQLLEPAAS